MSERSLLTQTVEDILATGLLSGLSVLVAHRGKLVERVVRGHDARGRDLQADSIFPVASITKMALALAFFRLVEEEEIALDDRLSDYLPQAEAARGDINLRQLLCHISGLPTDVDERLAPYNADLSWEILREACLKTPLEAPPQTRLQYSNVGYGLLGAVLEVVMGTPFNEVLGSLVLRPLQIEGYLGDEPPRQTAAISHVRGAHAGTEIEPYNSRLWRSLALPWGGLFTTAEGALKIVQAFAGRPEDFLQPETRALAVADHTHGLAGGFITPLWWDPCPWGLGPDLRGTKKPHWVPASASPQSFGHSGASGCLAWADPSKELEWVILGTRTADSGWLLRRGPAIGDAIYASLEHYRS